MRVRRALGREILPSMEEAERRIRSGRGLLASLTPEQLAFIEEYDGPVSFGLGGSRLKSGRDAA